MASALSPLKAIAIHELSVFFALNIPLVAFVVWRWGRLEHFIVSFVVYTLGDYVTDVHYYVKEIGKYMETVKKEKIGDDSTVLPQINRTSDRYDLGLSRQMYVIPKANLKTSQRVILPNKEPSENGSRQRGNHTRSNMDVPKLWRALWFGIMCWYFCYFFCHFEDLMKEGLIYHFEPPAALDKHLFGTIIIVVFTIFHLYINYFYEDDISPAKDKERGREGSSFSFEGLRFPIGLIVIVGGSLVPVAHDVYG